MYTNAALLDLHERAHRSFRKLIAHCGELDENELNRKLEGFGYSTVQLQLHHAVGAEKYWIGVLQGKILVDDKEEDFPSVASLEAFRQQVFATTQEYLSEVSPEELNTVRTMMTWGNKEKLLTPAHVFMRTLTHIFQHQGQITAMCRVMGKPVPAGLDFPLD